MLSPVEQVAELEHVVRVQMDEIDRLRALLDKKDADMDVLVQWIAEGGDALSTLQAVYVDPRQSSANKIRAAVGSLPYERARVATLSGVMVVGPGILGARLDQTGMRVLAPSTIEASAMLASDNSADTDDAPDPAA
jgi:hypothetical protein